MKYIIIYSTKEGAYLKEFTNNENHYLLKDKMYKLVSLDKLDSIRLNTLLSKYDSIRIKDIIKKE